MSVLEYKSQRKQIFGKLCYKKWLGEEEVAQARAMNQLENVTKGEKSKNLTVPAQRSSKIGACAKLG